MKMPPSERIRALARPTGHQWADLAGLRVCIYCGCAHDTDDALERCVPIHPHPEIEAMEYAMHLHDLQCANETPIEAKQLRDQEKRKLRECAASLADLPARRIQKIVADELRNDK